MSKSRIIALAVFVLCLGLAFWISRQGEKERANQPTVAGPDVVFPRQDRTRRAGPGRKRPKARTAPLDTERPTKREVLITDPLERAVSVGDGKGAVFVEVNALQETPLVKKMLKCRGQDADGALQKIEERIGLDPTRDIDRVALSDGVVAASGFFKKLQMPEELGAGEALGEDGRLYSAQDPDGDTLHIATMGDDLMMFGNDRAALEQAVARARGDEPVTAPALPFAGAMGDVYGRVSGAFISSLLGSSDNAMAQQAAALIQDGMIRATVGEHVAMSMDFSAVDDQSAEDLSRTLGGLIAAGRLRAVEQEDKVLERLLEKARVKPGDGGKFEVDLALPGDLVLETMGCDQEGNPTGGLVPGGKHKVAAPHAGAREQVPSTPE